MPRWTFAVAPWNSPGDGRELTAAKDRTLTFRRRDAATAGFTIDGRHDEALELVELVSDLRAWRNGELLFRGRVGPTTDEIGDDHATTITVGDYRAVLDRRFLREGDAVLGAPVNGDAGTVAFDLVEIVQARTAGDLGIVAGVGIPAGRAMPTSTFSAGQSITEAIDLFALTDPATTGFEWQISPELELDVFPGGRARALGLVLDYGGLVDKVSRQVDPSTYANDLRVSGDPALVPVTRSAADLATNPRGRWEAQIAHPDAKTVDSLDGLADRDLLDAGIFRPAYTVTLKANRWEGPGALWVGDKVTLRARSGRVDVLDDLEVEELAVAVSEEGDEVVTLKLGSLFAGFVERLRSSETRLRRLERT